MDKEDVIYIIYIQRERDRERGEIYIYKYYSAIKKNGILPFAATWMDLEGIMLSEISQTEKDKYRMPSLKK